MTNIKKQALKDAAEYARAMMFYGEGAGTRRKLIRETVQWKVDTIPGYGVLFDQALARQNMAEHANKAVKERARKNISKTVGRNVRGVVTGNRRSLTTKVAVVVVVGTWAHNEGYDKAAADYVGKKYRQVKNHAEVRKMRAKVHNITDVKR